MRRKAYWVVSIALIFTSCSNRSKVEIKKIEHFYVSSTKAKELFQIFTVQLGLPIVWDYQDWGGFSSGGITLGNVVLELVESKSDPIPANYGMALEPSQSLKKIVYPLDSAKIAHGRISRAADWSTMSLNNLLPDNVNVFVCDYHDRDLVKMGREKAAGELATNHGGTLGLQFLKEIVIGTEAPGEFEDEWAKIPGIVKVGNEFHFPEGPALKLIKSESPLFGLFIKVASVSKARQELAALGFETRITAQGVELIDKIFVASIMLVE
ncbi:MAG: hypothetical protein R3D00_19515 [Bacteroidia bacterium]